MRSIRAAVLLVVFVLVNSLTAFAENRIHLGIGGAYGFKFGFKGQTLEFENTIGADLRLGYQLFKWLGLELEYSHLPDFYNETTRQYLFSPKNAYKIEFHERFDAYMVNLKLRYPYLFSGNLVPYVVGGVGRSILTNKAALTEYYLMDNGIWQGEEKLEHIEKFNNSCYKYGFGADLFLDKRWGIYTELSYWGINYSPKLYYWTANAGLVLRY